MTIRVAHLYPEYLNIYADRGNIAVLSSRARWRGIGFEVEGVSLGDELRPGEYDLFYIGGGQDREQGLIAPDLAGRAEAIREAVGGGAAVLAVCGGYQLLGRFYRGRDGDRASRRRALSAGDGCGRPADDRGLPAGVRARAGRAADAGRLREPRRRHAARRGRRAAGPGGRRVRERRGQAASRAFVSGMRSARISTARLLPRNAWLADWILRARARASNRRATGARPAGLTSSRTAPTPSQPRERVPAGAVTSTRVRAWATADHPPLSMLFLKYAPVCGGTAPRYASPGAAERPLGHPERPEVDHGIPGAPAGQEALDRRMEHDLVELTHVEQPVPVNGRVLRGHRLERPPFQVAGEDDVDDVFRGRRCARARSSRRSPPAPRPGSRH